MSTLPPPNPDQEKLLYKLVIQFLIFCQGSHKLLEPHLLQIGKRLKSGAVLTELAPELQAISKTLLHISKQTDLDKKDKDADQQNNYLLQRIDELLANSDVPLRFQQQKTVLRQRVKSNVDDQTFNKVIDSAMALLVDIKDYAVSEQKDIGGFLTQLSTQLGELEQHVEIVGQSSQRSFDQRQNLDLEINQQLGDIKDNTHQADELTTLKTITGDHLDRLMMQLMEHKQQEGERQQQAQQQIALMSEKLQALEIETEALRTKLKIEHDRALRDTLTGLPNRLAYKDRVEMEANRWKRYQAPLSLLVWDIDYFKRINDNYGHKAGDKTLNLVGQLLLNNCRSTDFVARYGGEEFVMLMPNTQTCQTLAMAEKVRDLIEHCGFNYNGDKIDLTISCGISEFTSGDQHDDVFVRADRALYQAKQAGRNRCVVYQNESIPPAV
ncbi:MAG: GGDEF domain-containing protein [Methylomonas sp.]|jgi:diguanylate cyclase|uniref:GGDEF domain-containing protein n=1 Tax=Methylomonas sp. TaxID=418 RepID=UPI0025DE4F1E|nr:GGDEF domain-containing protein [Methylomonas sp.]MCK9605523.1 GGDEF domain-containing protein [Methylomonas sp.]